MKAENICPKCQFEMTEQPRPFPVMLQTAFGISFLAFWLGFDAIRANKTLVWGWCLFQIVLGFRLVRARIRARGHVYRCIRCDSTLG